MAPHHPPHLQVEDVRDAALGQHGDIVAGARLRAADEPRRNLVEIKAALGVILEGVQGAPLCRLGGRGEGGRVILNTGPRSARRHGRDAWWGMDGESCRRAPHSMHEGEGRRYYHKGRGHFRGDVPGSMA